MNSERIQNRPIPTSPGFAPACFIFRKNYTSVDPKQLEKSHTYGTPHAAYHILVAVVLVVVVVVVVVVVLVLVVVVVVVVVVEVEVVVVEVVVVVAGIPRATYLMLHVRSRTLHVRDHISHMAHCMPHTIY